MAKRFTEPNIIHNPLKWFGIWAPGGWHIHQKRWGRATRETRLLSGDGRTTHFRGVLLDPATRVSTWDDDLHVTDDPFTDKGIYPCDPRVEYPVGMPRWAISHTLLCHPVADHNLYTHQYTWDLKTGDLRTHFRRHVELEPAITEGVDGRTVRVCHSPLSRSIEANTAWPHTCSAVRGVWNNPEKTGPNLYTRRVLRRLKTANGVYIRIPTTPVVQCWGIWQELPGERLDGEFGPDGVAHDPRAAAERLKIPWDMPRLALIRPSYRRVHSDAYEGEVSLPAEQFAYVSTTFLDQIRARLGSRYVEGRVGFAHRGETGQCAEGYKGFDPAYDLNADGVIDQLDVDLCQRHIGREVRINHYLNAYFGGDWISTGVLLAPDHLGGVPVIADYEYGGGYDAESGRIQLLQSPGPRVPVWVEYFHDVPAESGTDNIAVHVYRE